MLVPASLHDGRFQVRLYRVQPTSARMSSRTTIEATGLPGAPAGGVDVVAPRRPPAGRRSCPQHLRGEAAPGAAVRPRPAHPDPGPRGRRLRRARDAVVLAHAAPDGVPWSAVYVVACDDGRGVLYPEDVPEDVSVIAARATSDAATRATGDGGGGDLDAGRCDGPRSIAPCRVPARRSRAALACPADRRAPPARRARSAAPLSPRGAAGARSCASCK